MTIEMQKIQIAEKPTLDGMELHLDVCGSLLRLWVMDGKSKVGDLTAVILFAPEAAQSCCCFKSLIGE
jgi:hypothetical protein